MASPGLRRYENGMILNLPNTLTIGRLLAALALPLMFLWVTRPYADWLALGLFVTAAATDWIDGRLARAWGMETRFGAMLDPIADKAMVAVALLVISAFHGLAPLIVIPAAIILFREVFVSGLREFLGDTAGTLRVTRLAKWKTTVQMVAISVLFARGIFEHYFGMAIFGMDVPMVNAILQGAEEDELGLGALYRGAVWSWTVGVTLLWIAAGLTLLTGADYFRKALPHLREKP